MKTVSFISEKTVICRILARGQAGVKTYAVASGGLGSLHEPLDDGWGGCKEPCIRLSRAENRAGAAEACPRLAFKSQVLRGWGAGLRPGVGAKIFR